MTDIQRLEMLMFGIKVALVEPGGVATPIWDKMVDSLNRNYEAIPAEGKNLYEEAHRIGTEKLKMFFEGGIPPEKVAIKVIHALTSKKPKPYYKAGIDCYIILFLQKLMSTSAFDRFICRYLKYPYKASGMKL
jgi:short-subunit dehydrogenase